MARISNSKFKNGISSLTGNINGNVAGTAEAMSTVHNAQVRPGTLSATMVIDAETNTITMEAGWQVSADSVTWVTLALAPNNPAAVVIATGTGGADAAVTVNIPAPASVAGHRFVRAVIINRVASGLTADTSRSTGPWARV